MKRFVVLAVCLSVLITSQAFALSNINLFLGQKSLEKGDWEPIENQFEFGIEADYRQTSWPISLTIGLSYSKGSGTDTEYDDYFGFVEYDVSGSTTEVFAGIKKIFGRAEFHPFIGTGIAAVIAETEDKWSGLSFSDSEASIGAWTSAGAYWTISGHYNMGFQGKYSYAFDESRKSGGFHYGLIAGYSF